MSVSKFSRFYYLIKFEFRSEMLRVLRQGTKIIYGDIFMLHPWNSFINPQTFSINSEAFEIILHNLFHQQTLFPNVMRMTSQLRDLIAFNDPVNFHIGYSSMSVRVKMVSSQPLRFGVFGQNFFTGANCIAIQYLELPRLMYYFCKRLGHISADCIIRIILNHPRLQSP